MMEVLGSLAMKNVGEQHKRTVIMALQADASANRQNKNNKFVCERCFASDNPAEIRNLFIGVIKPDCT